MSDKPKLARITDVLSAEELKLEIQKPDNYLKQEFELHAFDFVSGNYGEYALLECTHVKTGEEFTFSCGGTTVVKELNALIKKNVQLPILIKFFKSGNTYHLG